MSPLTLICGFRETGELETPPSEFLVSPEVESTQLILLGIKHFFVLPFWCSLPSLEYIRMLLLFYS